MAADDVEFGHVVDVTLGEPSGTELVADAAIGATTLVVDYAGDFEDDGEVVLNGTVLAYTSIAYGDTETDPDTITLVAPLAAAAATDDRVGRMSGGGPVLDWLLHVSLGDGHDVDIPIPFEQRAMWSKMEASSTGGFTPVPVLVSADLERLVEVPGRTPSIDSAYVSVPKGRGVRTSADPVSVLHDTNTYIGMVTRDADFSTDDFTLDGSGHLVYSGAPCAVVATAAAAWAGNSTGYRRISILQSTAAASNTVTQVDPDTASVTRLSVTGIFSLVEGESLQVGLRQTSTAALDVTDIEIRAVVVGYL